MPNNQLGAQRKRKQDVDVSTSFIANACTYSHTYQLHLILASKQSKFPFRSSFSHFFAQSKNLRLFYSPSLLLWRHAILILPYWICTSTAYYRLFSLFLLFWSGLAQCWPPASTALPLLCVLACYYVQRCCYVSCLIVNVFECFIFRG